QAFRLPNRSVLELIRPPSYSQIRCPVVLGFSAPYAERDGPANRARLLVGLKRFCQCSDLIDLQQQSIAGIRFDRPTYAAWVRRCPQMEPRNGPDYIDRYYWLPSRPLRHAHTIPCYPPAIDE